MSSIRLRLLLLLCAALLAAANVATAQGATNRAFKLRDGDRVVFYGDSITEQRLYTTFIEDYVVTRFPRLNVNFVHSGWGGDSVGGGGGGPIDLRLQRDVFAYKPTVMTIMLGMNDGRYRSFDQGIYDAYRSGYIHILDTLKTTLPDLRLTLIQPSPYDDVTRKPNFEGGYNAVLVRYGQLVQELAQTNHREVADLNAPVIAMLDKARSIDPDTAQKIIPDRVHPGPAGHLIMAEAVLKSWNAPSVVSDVEIDAARKRAVRARNCKVIVLDQPGLVAWTQTDEALPMPLQWSDPVMALALKSSDFTEALDQETLRVTGLPPAPRYVVKIDGQDAGEFTPDQLAHGVNLAPLATPMSRQANNVVGLIARHNDQHFMRWRTIQVPLEGHKNPQVLQSLPPLLAALDAEEAETVAQLRLAAMPTPHRYELAIAQPGPTGPNLALKKPYTTDFPNTFGWGNGGLTDGSWEANSQHCFATDNVDKFPKTVTIDLQAPALIGTVLLGVPPFGSTETIRVSVSADGQKFTDVGSYAFSQRNEERHTYRFPAVTARYVRLTYPDHYPEAADYDPTFMFTTEVEVYAPAAK